MIILHGKIGSGKTTAANIISKYASVLDADDWFKTFKETTAHDAMCNRLFDRPYSKDLAFVHENWQQYEKGLVVLFLQDAVKYDVAVMPVFPKYASMLVNPYILEVQRVDAVNAAYIRDAHVRPGEITSRIIKEQSAYPIILADTMLTNSGSLDFMQEVEQWAKSQLPAALTRRTQVING